MGSALSTRDDRQDSPAGGASRPTQTLSADAAGITRAADLIRAGGLVAFPTETVYGLGADATSAAAVAGIYAAKERPRFNPLIAHLPTLQAAEREGVFDEYARSLAQAFWPGPLTLVVPVSASGTVCDLARAGLDSVALRVPDHVLAREVLAQTGRPVAAPSANPSGRVSPTSAAHVLADMTGRVDAVLDGGETAVGVESTIVACLGGVPRLLRPGGLAREAIEAVLGRSLAAAHGEAAAPRAPGMLASHYAPAARVRLNATTIAPGEAALLFGPEDLPGVSEARAVRNLSPSGDLPEAAANLFAYLRALDASGAPVIAVAPIPETGLGEAIADRLSRAAADR